MVFEGLILVKKKKKIADTSFNFSFTRNQVLASAFSWKQILSTIYENMKDVFHLN